MPPFANIDWEYFLYVAFFVTTIYGIVSDRRKSKPKPASEGVKGAWAKFFVFLNDQAVDAAILLVLIAFASVIDHFEHYVRPGGWIFFEENSRKSFKFDNFLDLLDISAVLYIVHRAIRRIFNVLPFD